MKYYGYIRSQNKYMSESTNGKKRKVHNQVFTLLKQSLLLLFQNLKVHYQSKVLTVRFFKEFCSAQ